LAVFTRTLRLRPETSRPEPARPEPPRPEPPPPPPRLLPDFAKIRAPYFAGQGPANGAVTTETPGVARISASLSGGSFSAAQRPCGALTPWIMA